MNLKIGTLKTLLFTFEYRKEFNIKFSTISFSKLKNIKQILNEIKKKLKKNKLSINYGTKKLLIKKGDNLIIHGDAGAIEQLNLNNVKKFQIFF